MEDFKKYRIGVLRKLKEENNHKCHIRRVAKFNSKVDIENYLINLQKKRTKKQVELEKFRNPLIEVLILDGASDEIISEINKKYSINSIKTYLFKYAQLHFEILKKSKIIFWTQSLKTHYNYKKNTVHVLVEINSSKEHLNNILRLSKKKDIDKYIEINFSSKKELIFLMLKKSFNKDFLLSEAECFDKMTKSIKPIYTSMGNKR